MNRTIYCVAHDVEFDDDDRAADEHSDCRTLDLTIADAEVEADVGG